MFGKFFKSAKRLLAAALAAALCLGLALVSNAQPSPREAFLDRLGHQPCGKVSESGVLRIVRLEGDLVKEAGLALEGSVFRFDADTDAPARKARVRIAAESGGIAYSGTVFLDDEKIVLDRGAAELLRELMGLSPAGDGTPEYVWFRNPYADDFWRSAVEACRSRAGSEELLRFLLEAVPEGRFAFDGSRIVLELDQAGLEESVLNLVRKVRDERERFAALAAGLAAASDPGVDPEKLKAEILASIEQAAESGRYPSEEDVKEFAKIFQLEKLRCEVPTAPGGSVRFEIACVFYGRSADAPFERRPVLNVGLSGEYSCKARPEMTIDVPVLTPDNSAQFGGFPEPGGRLEFSDVPPGHWAFGPVREMARRGVLHGTGDGRFDPDAPVTREQFAKMLVLALGLPLDGTAGGRTFADVPPERWSFRYVEAAKGCLPGRGGGLFGPEIPAAREEVAAAVAKALGLTEADPSLLSRFGDAEEISEGLRPWVAAAVRAGLAEGYPDGTFRPRGTLTRAEAAALLWRAVKAEKAAVRP